MSTRQPAAAPGYDCDHCGQPISTSLRAVIRITGTLARPGSSHGPANHVLATYDLHDQCEMPFARKLMAQAPSVPPPGERWPEEQP